MFWSFVVSGAMFVELTESFARVACSTLDDFPPLQKGLHLSTKSCSDLKGIFSIYICLERFELCYFAIIGTGHAVKTLSDGVVLVRLCTSDTKKTFRLVVTKKLICV